jgi:hypothetical protein
VPEDVKETSCSLARDRFWRRFLPTCSLSALGIAPTTEAKCYERRTRYGANECCARRKVQGISDDHKQKYKQADYQSVSFQSSVHVISNPGVPPSATVPCRSSV